jgi:predicted Zn-dependent protease
MGANKQMDKIAGLKKILAVEPGNSLARYGLAMELSGQGETDAALAEFDTLLAGDPNYTAGYQMSAQMLADAGRAPEAIARLKKGIECATRCGNRHAASQMQAMLDELDR